MASEYALEEYFARAFRNLFLYPFNRLSQISVRALNDAAAATRTQHPEATFPTLQLAEKAMEWARINGSFGPDVVLTARDGSEIEAVFEIKLGAKWNWTEFTTLENYAPIETPLARRIRDHYVPSYSNAFQTDAYLAWQWWEKTGDFNNAPLTLGDDAAHIIFTLDGRVLSAARSRNEDPLVTDVWIPIEIREFVKALNTLVEHEPNAVSEEEHKMLAAFGLTPFRRSSRYESRLVVRGRGQGDWSDHDEQQEASHPGAGRP